MSELLFTFNRTVAAWSSMLRFICGG